MAIVNQMIKYFLGKSPKNWGHTENVFVTNYGDRKLMTNFFWLPILVTRKLGNQIVLVTKTSLTKFFGCHV
jgi:hypothetical protein